MERYIKAKYGIDMHIMHNYAFYMQEALLVRIADLERELEELYEEYDASDYTHYGKHVTLANNILKKSEELTALKNGLELVAIA